MRITKNINPLKKLNTALSTGRVEQGKSGNSRIVARVRVDAYIIELGPDGKWRWVNLSTYGHTRPVHGLGCDDCGYIVTDTNLAARLDALLAR